jgi:uncharacterized iron-regulated protein
MRKKLLITAIVSLFLLSFTNDKPAYTLFTDNGKDVKFSEMITDLATADFVFIGELHNNPISHWLELEITKEIYKIKKQNTILGAEMFETDDQLIIDEYLTNVYPENKFEPELKLWPNYKTDYKPLLNFAKDSSLSFIATNIPRRYASVVFKSGFEGLENLTGEAKKYIAPLPIKYDKDLDCYKDMMNMGGMPAHANENLPKSQAIKDATMANFINLNWKDGKTFIHYNGSYHSDKYQGIVWYLKKYNKKAKIKTITTVLQSDLSKLNDEYKKQADYIIVVDENMTGTY